MPETRTVLVNGNAITVPEGSSAASAVFMAQADSFRRSVSGEPRWPVCGMGICFECRVTIDGRPHRLSCQVRVEDGMEIETE